MGTYFYLLLLIYHFFFTIENEKIIYSKFITDNKATNEIARFWPEQGDIVLSDKNQGSDNVVFISSQWNLDSLYLFFTVKDKDMRAYQTEQDHQLLYLDDMVEVLIDPNNDRDSCWRADDIVYHINILGTKKDDRGTSECNSDAGWNGTATYDIKVEGTINDTTDIDFQYSVELAIPWEELRIKPVPGRKIAINFANGDNDGKGRQLFDWVGAWPLRSTYAFGDLVLFK